MTTRLQRYWDVLKKSAQADPAGLSSSHTNYEQALANIARAYINDTAPSLSPYELGFQLVEKSDDNMKAKGIFGYKIGNNLIYVPIFYVNGKIHGYDMMYLYKEKMFLPILEGIVSQLIKDQPLELGRSIDSVGLANKLALPNLMQLKPTTLKWAMDQPTWLRPFIPDFINMYHYPTIKWSCNPFEVIKTSSDCAARFNEFLLMHPRWLSRLKHIYDTDLDKFLIKTAIERGQKKPVVPTLKGSAKPADVELLVYVHETSPTRLSPTELAKLRQQGYLVRDNRKATAMVRLKPNILFESAHNVTHAGFHHLLLKDLTIVCAYVVPVYSHSALVEHPPLESSKPLEDKKRQYLVVPIYSADEKGQILRRFSGKYGFVTIDRNVIAVSQPADIVEHSFGIFQDAKDLTPREGDTYSFFTEKLATPPFTLSNVSSKSHRGHLVFSGYDHSITLDVSERRLKARQPYRWLSRTDNVDHPNVGSELHFIAPLSGTKVATVIGNVKEAGKDEDEEQRIIRQIYNSLARLDDLLNELVKSSDYTVQVHKKDAEYIIERVPYRYFEALELLLKKYNCSEQDALKILKTAGMQPKTWLIKQAQPELLPQMPMPPSAPPMPPEPARGTFGGVNFQSPTLQAQGVPMPDKPYIREQGRLSTPWFDRLLEKAIQSGQKEVLDVSVLSSLLNITSDEDIIENNLPKALEGLSALGAMRFGIYAHWDVFAERYGEEDLERKEKALRTVFKEVGKVLFELQQRPQGFNEHIEKTLLEAKK